MCRLPSHVRVNVPRLVQGSTCAMGDKYCLALASLGWPGLAWGHGLVLAGLGWPGLAWACLAGVFSLLVLAGLGFPGLGWAGLAWAVHPLARLA